MTQKTIQENTACATASHATHLCHLMYEGFHFQNREAYKAVVQDAQFRCQQCGYQQEACCFDEVSIFLIAYGLRQFIDTINKSDQEEVVGYLQVV